MKIKKILILVVLLTFLSIVSTLSIYAEDIDYNVVLGINIGSETEYYSTYGLNGATWKDYIKKAELYEGNGFSIVNDLVILNDRILYDRNGKAVRSNDRIIVAAGNIYTTEEVFRYDGTGFKFHALLYDITFAEYVNNVKNSVFTLRYGGYSTYGYVFYASCPLIVNDRMIVHNDIISNVYYGLQYDYECIHDYLMIEYCPANCTSDGCYIYKCDMCGDEKEEYIPLDPNTHVCIVLVSDFSSTCTRTGEAVYECSSCGEEFFEYSPLIPHNYVGGSCFQKSTCEMCGGKGLYDFDNHLNKVLATCEDEGYCKDCNAIFPATGHDNDFWGKCKICGVEFQNQNNGNDFDIKQFFSDLKTDYDDSMKGIGNFLNKFFNVMKVTSIAAMMIGVLIFVYYGLSFVNNVNTFKDRYKQRRSTRIKKGNKRK